MTAVTIRGTFSKDERPSNGLEEIADDLVKNQFDRHYIVGLVQFAGGNVTGPGEGLTPAVKFAAIEVVSGDDAVTVKALLDKTRASRDLAPVQEQLFDTDRDDDPDDDGEEMEGQTRLTDHGYGSPLRPEAKR